MEDKMLEVADKVCELREQKANLDECLSFFAEIL